MKVAFLCPKCSRENERAIAQPVSGCDTCGNELALKVSELMKKSNIIDRCCVCGNDRFYVQKDFNRKLGLAIVALGIILSYLLFGFQLPALILGLTVCLVIDLLLYRVLPEVTVCYACHAIYRGYSPNPDHGPFDLNIAEEFDHR